MRTRRFTALTLTLALGGSATLLAACSSSGSSSSTTTPSATATCNATALNAATGPVTINFWESAARANATVLANLTNQFNASQTKVHVNLVVQTSYADTWQKVKAGLSNGQLPDVAQIQDTDTQGAIDTGAFLNEQNCINGFSYQTSDFLPRALAYWNVNHQQWAMPFAVSGPVLYFNQNAFTKAGLNPATPPATLSQMVADAKTLKTAGQGGMGLVLDPWHFETWLATENDLLVNHNNGRTGRATAVAFNTPAADQIFSELNQMVSAGDATTNSAQGAAAFDNLLGVGSGKYSMTIDTSAALGTIQSLLATGQYPNVKLGVAPFPTAVANATGGVQPGGSALWISSKSSPAKEAAAWEFVTFLDNTASQATWAAGTGYIPLRTSSANTPTIQKLWATNPQFKVAYTQLVGGAATYASAGAVLGSFDDVRTAIATAEATMFLGKESPSAAVTMAANSSNALISNYNQRIGQG
jgi:sn-glycerol 3-phosphate transport system substrate-binding protein